MPINFTNLNNACVAYYSFDNADVSGDIVFDLTPNGNDGTASNTRVFGGSGILNEGADFTQGDDLINISSIGSISGTAIISGWYNFQGSSSQQYIGRFHNNSNFQFALIRGYIGQSIELYFTGSSRKVIISSPSTNNWYHIVFVKTSNTNVDTYVDGVYVNSLSISSLSSFSPILLGGGTGSSQGNVYIDEFTIFDSSWTSAGTAQDIVTHLFNSGAPTVNQQYPFSSNVETLNLDTLTTTSTFNDIDFVNTYILDVDTLTTTNTFNDVEIFNEFLFNLDTLSITNTFNNVEFISADIFELDTLSITNTFNDIDFVSTYIENLDTLTTTNTFNDIDFVNTYILDINTLQVTNTFNDILILEGISDLLELETLTITNTFNDVEFILVNPLLISARNDIQQVLEEIGEPITYKRINKEFDDVGQLKEFTTTDYSTLALFEDGDDKNKQTNEYGEFISGTQNVNIAYQVSDGVYPKVRDIIIDVNGVEWEIIQVRPSRLYGGVWDNNVVVQRKTNFQ